MAQDAADLHQLLLPQLQLGHHLEDVVVEDPIEFEQQSCDGLEEADVVLVVGEDEVDDVLDELLVLADHHILGAVLLRKLVDLVEIEEVHFLMRKLAFLVEVDIEVAQAIQGLDQLVLEHLVAIVQQVDVDDRQVYHLDMHERVHFVEAACGVTEDVIQELFVYLSADGESDLLHL